MININPIVSLVIRLSISIIHRNYESLKKMTMAYSVQSSIILIVVWGLCIVNGHEHVSKSDYRAHSHNKTVSIFNIYI